jgi:flagellar biosynthesis/type III secretory pathway M-ring protein FliF/YscJ
VTGFNADRGDQLIVESLPFETSTLDAMQATLPTSPKPDAGPPWLVFVNKYRDVLWMAIGGLVLLSILISFFLRSLSRRAAPATAEKATDELEAAAARRSVAAKEDEPGAVGQGSAGKGAVAAGEAAALVADAQQLLVKSRAESVERVRQFAQKESEVSANVLRIWLHDQKS